MRFYFFIVFFILKCVVLSQSYTFTNYSIPEGLAQTQVKSITEDEKGYLWIGTLGGLSRFNGASFQNFSTSDGLLNNRVTALFSHKDKLWIGHQGGVSLYESRRFKTWSFGEQFKNISVTNISVYKSKLLISTNGNGFYVLDDKGLRNVLLASNDQNRIRGFTELKGVVYAATRAGLITTKDLIHFNPIQTGIDLNLTGVVAHNNELFFSSTFGQIFNYNVLKQTLKQIIKSNSEVYLNSFLIDSKSQIWSASSAGVLFKSSIKSFELIDENVGLSFSCINTIYEDKNGTIWLGSDGKGLFRFAGKQVINYNKRNGISSELITSALEYRKNMYLFGSYDNGLITFIDNKFNSFPLKKNSIWASITDNQNYTWIGTDAGLVKTNHSSFFEFDVSSGSPGNKITCFYKSKEGIYVGGSEGLSLIQHGEPHYLTPDFNGSYIGTIRNVLLYKGKLICASDGGAFIFENGKFKRFLNHKLSTSSLVVDDNDRLWIGSEDGLFYTEGKTLKKFYLSAQPASNYINFINYHNKKLFIGSNNGLYVLSKLDKLKKVTINHFGLEEGVVNLETNINSSLIDHSGFLWFGTASGLVKFDTKALENIQLIKPNLNIKSIKLNFQDFNFQDFSSGLTKEGLPLNLSLPHNKNNLIIELDGIQLKNHADLKFEYWLEGSDEKWISNSNSPIINLSNLQSGDYILHLRTINSTGISSSVIKLPIIIRPVFYKTWWFILLALMVIGGVIYLYLRYRINYEKSKRYQADLEYKTKLLTLEQQSLNASMNRHFIFNSLNSIQYFINTQDKYSANKYLTNFAKLIRKNLDASTENNNQVSLKQEIERLELYLSLEAMRFKDKFDYVIDTGDIDTESIQVPAMLFQPFVENSIMHGILPNTEKKGLIRIELKEDDHKLIVVIEDNGIGINQSMAQKGKHAGDHKSQGMEITAKRINLMSKLSRQDFELEGPYQIEDKNRSINGTRVLIKIPC